MLVLAVAAVVMVLVFPGKDGPVRSGADHDSDTAYL
jgi:hypothetical protein